MHIAKSIGLAKTGESAWDIIRKSRGEFIWTDDEELVEFWNRIASRVGGTASLELDWGAEPNVRLGDLVVQVPLVRNRDDKFIMIHAISQIGRDVLEIRFCKASAHSSDQAYLPCAPELWRTIESEVGAQQMQAQFMTIAPNLKDFAKALYAPFQPPTWAQ